MNKIERRAYLAVYYIWQNESMGETDSNTAYRISQYWGIDCTPQTMTNTLMRYARKMGIEYVEMSHRPNSIKRVWKLSSNPIGKVTSRKAVKIGESIFEKMGRTWIDEK